MQIVMDDRWLHKIISYEGCAGLLILLHRVTDMAASGYRYYCIGVQILLRRVTDITASGYRYYCVGLRIWLHRVTDMTAYANGDVSVSLSRRLHQLTETSELAYWNTWIVLLNSLSCSTELLELLPFHWTYRTQTCSFGKVRVCHKFMIHLLDFSWCTKKHGILNSVLFFAFIFNLVKTFTIHTDNGTLTDKGMWIYLTDKTEDSRSLTLLG